MIQQKSILIVGRKNGQVQMYDVSGQLIVEYNTTPFQIFQIFADFENNIIISVDNSNTPRFHLYPPNKIIQETELQNSVISQMIVLDQKQMIFLLVQNKTQNIPIQQQQYLLILNENDISQVYLQGYCLNSYTINLVLNNYLNQVVLVCSDSSLRVFDLNTFTFSNEIAPIFPSYTFRDQKLLNQTIFSFSFGNPSTIQLISCLDWNTSWTILIPNFYSYQFILNQNHNVIIITDGMSQLLKYDLILKNITKQNTLPSGNIQDFKISQASADYFMLYQMNNVVALHLIDNLSLYSSLIPINFIYIYQIYELNQVVLLLTTGDILFYKFPQLNLVYSIKGISKGDQFLFFNRRSPYLISSFKGINVIDLTSKAIVSQKIFNQDIIFLDVFFELSFIQVQFDQYSVDILDLYSLNTIQVIKLYSPIIVFKIFKSNEKAYFCLQNGQLQIIDMNQILITRQLQQNDSLIPYYHKLPTAVLRQQNEDSTLGQNQFFYYNYLNYKLNSFRPIYQLQDNLSDLIKNGGQINMHIVGNNLYILVESTLLVYLNVQVDRIDSSGNLNENLFKQKIIIHLQNCCQMLYYPMFEQSIIYLSNKYELIRVNLTDSSSQILYKNQLDFLDVLFYESKTISDINGYFWMVILESQKLIVFDLKNNSQQQILQLLSQADLSYIKISYNYEQFKQSQDTSQFIFMKLTKYSQFSYPSQTEFPLGTTCIYQSDGTIFVVDLSVFLKQGIPISSDPQKFYLQYNDQSIATFQSVLQIVIIDKLYIIAVLQPGKIEIFQTLFYLSLQSIIPPSYNDYKISIGLYTFVVFNKVQFLLIYLRDFTMMNFFSPTLQQIDEIYILQENLFLIELHNQLQIFSIDNNFIQMMKLEVAFQIYQDWNQTIITNPINTLYQIIGTFAQVNSIQQQPNQNELSSVQINLIASSLENYYEGTLTILFANQIEDNSHLSDGYIQNVCKFTIKQSNQVSDNKYIVSLISQLQIENRNQGWTSQRIVYEFQTLDTFSFIIDQQNVYTVVLIRNTNTSEIENYYFTPQERINIYVTQSYSFETPVMAKLFIQHVFFIFTPNSGFIVDSQDNWLNELIISDGLVQQELDQVSILVSNVNNVAFDQIVLDGLYKYKIQMSGELTEYDGQDLTNHDHFLIGMYNIQNVVFNNIMIMNYKQISTKNPLLVFIKCQNVTINGFTFINNIIYDLSSIISFIDVGEVSLQNIVIQNNTVANITQNNNTANYLSPIALQFNATQTVKIYQVLFIMNSQLQFIEMSNAFSVLGNDSIYDNLTLNFTNGVFISNKITKGIIQILQITQVYFDNLNFQANTALQNIQLIKQIKIKNYNSLDYILQDYKQFLILVSDSKELSMNKCDFQKNHILGSMIYIFSSQYIINNLICNLNINQISSGGCLYSYLYNNQQIQETNTIMNSNITSNLVRQGEGGAIYLHTSNLKLINTIIKNNTSLVGGGIKYINIVPDFIYDQTVFIGGKQLVSHEQNNQTSKQNLSYIQNNTANLYGANIGSVIHSIIVQYDNKELANFQSGAYLKQNLTIFLLDEEGNQLKISQKVLEQLTKYQEISFTIQIVDYNSIIQQQKGTQQQQNEYAPLLINGKSIKDLDQFNTTLQGFQFNVSFSGYPLKQSMFVVQTSQTVVLDLRQKQFSIGQIQKSIKINFRDCQIGEVPFQPTASSYYMECLQCQLGMYSIQKYQMTDNKQHSCLLCPQTAEYCEKDYLKLLNGYWRESYYSDDIYYCEKAPNHCINNQTLPGPESKNYVNYCLPGYIGPLCMSCDEFGKVWQTKFYKISKTECISEDMHLVVLIKGILYSIALSILIGLFAYFSMRRISCYRIKHILKVTGIMMLNKSVVDYQSIFYIKQGFVYYVLHFRIHQISLTNISEYDQLNSMLVNSAQIPIFYFYEYPTRSTIIPIIYQKIIRAFIYPLLPIAIIYVFYEILIKLKYAERKKYFYINVVLIYFMMYHSSFLEVILMPLQCQLIGNTYRISFDTQFECYSPNHIQYFLFLIFPICLLTTLSVVLIGFKLYQIRKKLHLICNQNYMGIIYVEFKDNYYYWTMLQTAFSLAFCFTFNIIEGNFFFKGLIFTLFNLLYLYLLMKHMPFKNKKLQKLCIQSNLTILIQFFIQILILNITDTISQINEYSDNGLFQASYSQEYFLILVSQFSHILFCLKILFLIIIEISLTKTYIGRIFYLIFKKIKIIIPQEFKSYYQSQINTQRVQYNWRKVKKNLFGSKLDLIQLQNNLNNLQTNQNLISQSAHKMSISNKKRNTTLLDGQPSFYLNPQQTFELTSNDQQEIFSYNNHSFQTNQKLHQGDNFSITNLDIIKEYKKKMSQIRLKSITPSPLKRESRQSNSGLFNFHQCSDDQLQSKDQMSNQKSKSNSNNNFMISKKSNNLLSSKNIIKINKVSSEIQKSDEILQLDNTVFEKKQNALNKINDFDFQQDSIKETSQLDGNEMEISQQSNAFGDLNNEVEQKSKDITIEGINRTLDIKIGQKQFKSN
ncbi:transmembrane protein, putative (macronuclear) [Tetrahymena thermophila SB210]|uniref:Transmembrane protein, putative n=1 Tax=Tetrahymena thermophila (strain SB210) TaxID=312017 RepID=I7M394_TETTS|nr:transmembrane protein, putative [Tetrahymena thermophila SB210]EAS02714.2 transmembrane protein, putative [Tetrahymena thermophila SB210]|eukprot:XP_001022959.2 transmembrane protein, putative [Tetrahymena thermophila SB210]